MKKGKGFRIVLAAALALVLLAGMTAAAEHQHTFSPWVPVPGENLHSRRCSTCDLLETEAHRPGTPQKSNIVPATCTTPGSHDEVVYCAACNVKMSEATVIDPPLGHSPGNPVEENRVEPRPGIPGSYDKVVYCTACGTELSREKVTIDPLPTDPPQPTEPPMPTDPPKPTDPPAPTPTPHVTHVPAANPAEIVVADAPEEADEALGALRSALEAGDVLAALPEEIRAGIPEGMDKVSELQAMHLVNAEKRKGTVFVRLNGLEQYPADAQVYVIIRADSDPEPLWLALKGTGHRDGALRLTFEAETLEQLADKVFTVLILTQ